MPPKGKPSSSQFGSTKKGKVPARSPHWAVATVTSPPPTTAAGRRWWKLLIIDQEPVRQAATETYRRAGERLGEVRATLEKFSTVDEPAYNHWLAGNFGALLTEGREIEERIGKADAMLGTIEMMTMLGRFGPREAYEAALKGQTAVEDFRAKRDAAGDAEGEEDDSAGDAFDEEAAFEDMFGEFAKMFGFKVPPGAGKGQPPPPGEDAWNEDNAPPGRGGRRGASRSATKGGAGTQTESQRLKTAYRAVVRRLHPDLNPDVSEYAKQLWHDAQSAYNRGDLDRLESILAVSELELGGELPAGSGIGGVLELTRQLEASIGQLERQVRGLKKNPAWNFSELPSRKALEKKVWTQLSRDVSYAKKELAALEEELDFYRNAPPRPTRKPPQKKPRKPAAKKKK